MLLDLHFRKASVSVNKARHQIIQHLDAVSSWPYVMDTGVDIDSNFLKKKTFLILRGDVKIQFTVTN